MKIKIYLAAVIYASALLRNCKCHHIEEYKDSDQGEEDSFQEEINRVIERRKAVEQFVLDLNEKNMLSFSSVSKKASGKQQELVIEHNDQDGSCIEVIRFEFKLAKKLSIE